MHRQGHPVVWAVALCVMAPARNRPAAPGEAARRSTPVLTHCGP